jgi:PE-PPE domain-containing protein
MRKSAKALLLVLVAIVGSVGLTVGAAFSAAFAFGAAIGLIVPGTGTHDVLTSPIYRGNAALRYIDPATGPNSQVCTSTTTASCNTVGVDYPATFFPLVIFSGWCPNLSCDTWDKSVGQGVTSLATQVGIQLADHTPNPDGSPDIVIFGYSQGGAVVSRELVALNNDPNLTQEQKDRITAVTIGNINNPLGLWSRLSFLPTIPILDISFGPQLPTDGISSTNYSFEYDPVGDAPQYWGNPVTMLNALAAFGYVHGYYLSPNENGTTDTLPYGYTPGPDGTLAYAIDHTEHIQYQNATFVLIPQQGALPLYQPFVDLATTTGTRALVDPVISLIQPVTKVIINLGYDRTTNPGIARTLSILPADPFQNWFTVGENLAGGVVEGVTNVVDGVDVTTPPTTPPADASLVDANSTQAAELVANDQSTVVDQKPADADTTTPVAKTKDTPLDTTVTKLKDVTTNRPVATAIKKVADNVGAQLKSTADKVKAAVKKATTPKAKDAA